MVSNRVRSYDYTFEICMHPMSFNPLYYVLFIYFADVTLLQQPLYTNAPLSTEASMYTTHLYAIKNKLSYEATAQLLDLLRIHFPSPNFYPSSLHVLRKHLSVMSSLSVTQFCSNCRKEVPQQQKRCSENSV